MQRKKYIGITGFTSPNPIELNNPLHSVKKSYIRLIEAFEALPIILPNTKNISILKDYARLIDGLLIPGGGDIHPKYYERKKEKLTGKHHMTIDTERDETELFLVKECTALKKPVLGICRGCQLINVALGGTLTQDLTTGKDKITEVHLDLHDEKTIFAKRHTVAVLPTSRMAKIIKRDEFAVNSAHHQAVEKIGDNLLVAATSPGGVIEAIEGKNGSFLVGVQWHPEQMVNDNSTKLLMKAFLKARTVVPRATFISY